jgi:hypothetical protein
MKTEINNYMKTKIILLFALLFVPFTKNFHAETDIKNAEAIFIYNFLSHVQWPEGAVGSNYLIGVLGKTATYDYLVKYTTNRKVGNRIIEIKQLNGISEVVHCQVLLVSDQKSSEMESISQKLNGRSCLTVGERSGLTESGAVIDFNVVDGKLRYKINQENAKKQNLVISSTLTRMSL